MKVKKGCGTPEEFFATTKRYTTILIGHEIEPNDIAEPIRKWAISKKHYFSKRNIQAKFVVTVAWGFTSPAGVDYGALARKMMEHTRFLFQIGTQDCGIKDGSAWDPDATKNSRTKAVHFECEEFYVSDLYRYLTLLYSSSRPNSTGLELCKLGSFGHDMLINCQQMVTRQGKFHQNLAQFPCYDLENIDYKPSGIDKTLRQDIMEITVRIPKKKVQKATEKTKAPEENYRKQKEQQKAKNKQAKERKKNTSDKEKQ
jgi:hypothetical protein